MALILRYRLEPPDALNREVYDALCKQVGEVGLNVNIPLGEDGADGQLTLVGQFISVEGEHFEQRSEDGDPPQGRGADEPQFTRMSERPDGPPTGPVEVAE